MLRRPAPVRFNDDGWALLESHHEADFRMDWRSDPFEKLLFAIDGKGTLETTDVAWPIEPRAILCIPNGQRHRIMDCRGHPLSLYGVCLDRTNFAAGELGAAALSTIRTEMDDKLASHAERSFRELLLEEREARPGRREMQMAIITRLLAFLLRRQPSPLSIQPSSRQRVENYVDLLENQFWHTDDIDAVARNLGLSRRRFTQLFREVTGSSWLEYQTGLRMNHAKRLLQSTSISVRSVAFECGCRNLSHFYRIFRSTYGKPPGQLRQTRDQG